MNKVLELTAYVLMITAASSVIYRQFVPSRPAAAAPKVGAPIKLTATWDKPVNVVVAMTSTCHFCEESIPFYRQLGRAAAEGKISLTLASPEPASVFEPFVAKSEIAAGRAISGTSFADLQVSGTPTLIVVDQGGIVRKVLVGKQRDEERLLAELVPLTLKEPLQ